MSRSYYLICYDIRHARRLQRIHKRLTQCATALQYSVFLAHWDQAQLKKVSDDLAKLMELTEDDVRIFAVQAPSKAVILGKPFDFTTAGLMLVS